MTEGSVRLAGDGRLRKMLMVPASYQHPAKGHLGLWEAIISKHTQPSDTILDPMSGVGSSLLAALMGRNVICVELEGWMMPLLRANWAKMQTVGPMLGCELGQVTILQGDARNLSGILGLEHPVLEQNPDLAADVILSSPPYEGSITGDTSEATRKRIKEGKYHGLRPDVFTSPGNVAGSRYGDGYTRPSAIITSPPFQDQEPQADSDWFAKHRKEFGGGGLTGHYTRPDAIVTSPPYENSELPREEHDKTRQDGVHARYRYTRPEDAVQAQGNIGELRGAAYWRAMTTTYQECHRVLRPQGVMVLVLKGFTRSGLYVNLPQQTADLCESLGFRLFDTWKRELWSLSFWRILQKKNNPESWDERLRYESVVAFRREP